MDTITTLPDWVNNAVYVLVVLALAALTFWLIATIVRKVLVGFKQAKRGDKQKEEKMKISKDIIEEEIGKMEARYKKLVKLFVTKKEFIPECKEIKGSINDFLNIKLNPGNTYPNLKSNYSWLNEDGDKIIYMFSVTNFPYDISEINNKFDKEENISLCRINEKSPEWEKVKKDETVCLYVGSSKKIQTRLKEHLFSYNKNSYAMHLETWFEKKDLPITINIWDFSFLKDEEPASDYLQTIEDLLWNHYKPLLGKQGKK